MAVDTKPAVKADENGRTGLRRQLVEREILERAAELFAERGFAGTTVQNIADALGMSRPALYYYVKSKEAILQQLVENLSRHDAQILEGIERKRSADPAQKLREMAQQLAMNAGSNPHQTQILSQSKHHLPEDIAKLNLEAERSIAASLRSVIEAGTHSGQFRAVDPRAAAMSIVGMCLWTAWWVDDSARSASPTGDRAEHRSTASLEPVTEQIADQAVFSVIASDGDPDVQEPAALLRAARANLDRLQRSLGD